MTKMLSWANGEKFHINRESRPRGDGAEFRRRNRAREAEAVRQLINQEGDPISLWYWRETYYDMNNEDTAPSNEVWHALMENDQGLNFVDFDGSYTCESK